MYYYSLNVNVHIVVLLHVLYTFFWLSSSIVPFANMGPKRGASGGSKSK